jgi:hypothetical protein
MYKNKENIFVIYFYSKQGIKKIETSIAIKIDV